MKRKDKVTKTVKFREANDPGKVLRVERPVAIAMEVISEEERAAVAHAIQSYEAFVTVASGLDNVGQLSGVKNARTLRVTPDLRLVFEEQENGIHVLDLVRADAIDRLAIFNFDVFMSHSVNDFETVKGIAKRLREDGLKVWFDAREKDTTSSLTANVDEILAQSRVLLLFISEHTFGPEWSMLEHQTAIFRDPRNLNRRFVLVLLDDSKINDSLKYFNAVDYRHQSPRQYARLLSACRLPFILRRALAEIQHYLGYEGDYGVPARFRRRVARLAGLLEIADQEFATIRDEMKEYEMQVKTEVKTAPGKVGIDRFSLKATLEQNVIVREIDEQLAKAINSTITEHNAATLELLCKGLPSAGINTVEQLIDALKNHRELLVYQATARFREKGYRTVNRGISAVQLLWVLMGLQGGEERVRWGLAELSQEQSKEFARDLMRRIREFQDQRNTGTQKIM